MNGGILSFVMKGFIKMRTISQIANDIRKDWKNINFAASPYLAAMLQMSSLDEKYGCDSGSSIVIYFLSNASSWRREVAKKIKKELRDILKEAQ